MTATDVEDRRAAVLGTIFMMVAVGSGMCEMSFGHEMKGALEQF